MSQRKNTQDSLILALEILKRIPKFKKVTTSELGQQLEAIGITRSIRTIQRCVEMLSEHFTIVRDTRSKPYGYSWGNESRQFLASTLNIHESLLLALAEEHLQVLMPAALINSLEPFFSEARYNLNYDPKNVRGRIWRDKVRVVREAQPLLAPKIDQSVLENISNALYEDRLLSLSYRNSKGYLRQASVMPLGLALQGVRLYLICRFDGYDNERSLAIHRIEDAKISTFNFKRPSDFSLEKYDNDGRFGFGEGKVCVVKFDISKDAGFHLFETPLSADQTAIEIGEKLSISATVINSSLLDRWLKSFGSDVCNVVKITQGN